MQRIRPKFGQLAWDSKGNNDPNSQFFSRKAHVPSSASGVTIGRGYDLKHRASAEASEDLLAAGIPED